jgi:hypothetical protein
MIKRTVADEKIFQIFEILQESCVKFCGILIAHDEIFNSFKLWFAEKNILV